MCTRWLPLRHGCGVAACSENRPSMQPDVVKGQGNMCQHGNLLQTCWHLFVDARDGISQYTLTMCYIGSNRKNLYDHYAKIILTHACTCMCACLWHMTCCWKRVFRMQGMPSLEKASKMNVWQLWLARCLCVSFSSTLYVRENENHPPLVWLRGRPREREREGREGVRFISCDNQHSPHSWFEISYQYHRNYIIPMHSILFHPCRDCSMWSIATNTKQPHTTRDHRPPKKSTYVAHVLSSQYKTLNVASRHAQNNSAQYK